MLKPNMMCLTQTGATGAVLLTGNYPDWSKNVAGYSYTPIVLGGVGPYTFTVNSGAIPTGMSLNSSTGAITGVPTAGGTFTFVIRVTDSTPVTALTSDLSDTIFILADANWASVGLLMHFDGANNDTTTVDSSVNAFTVSRVGIPKLSTTQKKFGATSTLVPGGFGGGDNKWTVPHNSAFSPSGTGDFTIECWFYSNGWTVGANQETILFGQWDSTTCWLVTRNHSSDSITFYYNGTFPWFHSGTPTIGVWHHLAITRTGGNLILWLDGVATGVPIGIGATAITTSATTPLTIGSFGGASVDLSANAYIDDFRITKGVARYTSNFTPPALPFPQG